MIYREGVTAGATLLFARLPFQAMVFSFSKILENGGRAEKVIVVLGEGSAKFSADLPDIYGRARKCYRVGNPNEKSQ
jgi:hypothetical protein